MTTLDKIKLIDFYLHGVDRGRVKKSFTIKFDDEGNQEHFYATEYFDGLNYHTSLDDLRPVIVKLNQSDLRTELSKLNLTMSIYQYIYEGKNFEPVFDSVVECITYLNEKKQ